MKGYAHLVKLAFIKTHPVKTNCFQKRRDGIAHSVPMDSPQISLGRRPVLVSISAKNGYMYIRGLSIRNTLKMTKLFLFKSSFTMGNLLVLNNNYIYIS